MVAKSADFTCSQGYSLKQRRNRIALCSQGWRGHKPAGSRAGAQEPRLAVAARYPPIHFHAFFFNAGD